MIDKKARILVVDDSLAMRETVRIVLTGYGCSQLDSAANGFEALVKVKELMENNEMYQVIFLDWNMPEMNGLEFLKICRNDFSLKNIAIIMLTAVTDQKSVLTALQNGATFYIVKPVSSDTILKKLEQAGAWLEHRGRGP